MSHTVLQNCKWLQADAAVVSANNTTVNGDAIDTLGWGEGAFILKVYGTTGVVTVFKIQGSHNGSTGWTDITGAEPSALPGATDDNKNYGVFLDFKNVSYRYLRFVLTENNTGTIAGEVTAVLARGNELPSTDAERGLAASAIV